MLDMFLLRYALFHLSQAIQANEGKGNTQSSPRREYQCALPE